MPRSYSAHTRAHTYTTIFVTDDANVVIVVAISIVVGDIVASVDVGDVTAVVAVVAVGYVTYGTLGAFPYSLLLVLLVLWKF